MTFMGLCRMTIIVFVVNFWLPPPTLAGGVQRSERVNRSPGGLVGSLESLLVVRSEL